MTAPLHQEDLEAVPTDFESVLHFSLGMLDAMRTLCAEMIGLGLVPPDAFQSDFQRLADHWARQGNAVRREPAAYLLRALEKMERVARTAPEVVTRSAVRFVPVEQMRKQ
jgi:hypothetical protein